METFFFFSCRSIRAPSYLPAFQRSTPFHYSSDFTPLIALLDAVAILVLFSSPLDLPNLPCRGHDRSYSYPSYLLLLILNPSSPPPLCSVLVRRFMNPPLNTPPAFRSFLFVIPFDSTSIGFTQNDASLPHRRRAVAALPPTPHVNVKPLGAQSDPEPPTVSGLAFVALSPTQSISIPNPPLGPTLLSLKADPIASICVVSFFFSQSSLPDSLFVPWHVPSSPTYSCFPLQSSPPWSKRPWGEDEPRNL